MIDLNRSNELINYDIEKSSFNEIETLYNILLLDKMNSKFKRLTAWVSQ